MLQLQIEVESGVAKAELGRVGLHQPDTARAACRVQVRQRQVHAHDLRLVAQQVRHHARREAHAAAHVEHPGAGRQPELREDTAQLRGDEPRELLELAGIRAVRSVGQGLDRAI